MHNFDWVVGTAAGAGQRSAESLPMHEFAGPRALVRMHSYLRLCMNGLH